MLSQLPIEILNLITNFIGGKDCFSLWIASDQSLRTRIAKEGGITRFHLEYEDPNRLFWPGNFLKKLERLHDLSITLNSCIEYMQIKNINPHDISPTLRHLKFYLGKKTCFFLKPTFNVTSASNHSKNFEFLDLDQMFPRLETLEIPNQDLASVYLQTDFFRSLPKHLKSFHCLTKFEFEASDTSFDFSPYISLLPRSLTSLTILHSTLSNDAHIDPLSLPRDLTSLSTTANIQSCDFPKLPKSLNHLELLHLHSRDLVALLPLPKFVQKLHVPLQDYNDDHLFSKLEHVRHLVLESTGAQYGFVLPTKYPSSGLVTFEHFGPPGSRMILSGFKLPDSVTEIKMSGIKLSSPEVWFRSLPKFLTELSITEMLFVPFVHLLPSSLKVLSCSFQVPQKLSLLPKSLEKLSLHMNSGGFSCFESPNDLPNLKELTVAATTKMPEFDYEEPEDCLAEVDDLTIYDDEVLKLVQTLPQATKHLFIWGDAALTREIVEYLPRNLETLFWAAAISLPRRSSPCHDQFGDELVELLPPTLTKLVLGCNTLLTDLGVSKLPQHLISLDIKMNHNLTNECVKSLPRNLIDLSLPSRKITADCYPHLPKYLRSLSILSISKFDDELLTFENLTRINGDTITNN